MTHRTLFAAAVSCLMAVTCHAATITDPIPYLSQSDTPSGFFDVPPWIHCLQDFESADGPWEKDFSIDTGQRIAPKFVSGDGVPVTDSVDADDGAIDGDGTMGSSWFTRITSLSITFDAPTIRAGFVFTDTDMRATKFTITAYDPDDNVLVTREYDADFFDDVFTGTTQEDRFFGISAGAGERVKRINVAIDAGNGIEVDHIQFLKPIPEPTSLALVLIGLVGLCGIRRNHR